MSDVKPDMDDLEEALYSLIRKGLAEPGDSALGNIRITQAGFDKWAEWHVQVPVSSATRTTGEAANWAYENCDTGLPHVEVYALWMLATAEWDVMSNSPSGFTRSRIRPADLVVATLWPRGRRHANVGTKKYEP